MRWDRPTPNLPNADRYITSDCGRFRISKALVHGEWTYLAARVIPQPSVVVLGRGSLDECKQACLEASNEDRN